MLVQNRTQKSDKNAGKEGETKQMNREANAYPGSKAVEQWMQK